MAEIPKPGKGPKDAAAKADPAQKKIIIFSDGTGNSAAALFKTNVRRLYEALDLSQPDQIAVYDDGVGSSSFRPWAAITGAVGFGLARNVRALYRFLCRNYQPGDQIYVFGFSRGAFTVRVLVGLIASQGIIPFDSFKGREAKLHILVRRAYRNYRRNYDTNWSRMMKGKPPSSDVGGNGSGQDKKAPPAKYEDNRYSPFSSENPEGGVKVAFMGLWDTVEAYGLPIDEFTKGWNDWVWPLSKRDKKIWEGVQKVCHALALDDERNTFHPRLIDESKEDGVEPEKNKDVSINEERITQVWFTGMHADVGGGYAKDGLNYVTLKWMVDEAAKARETTKPGLVFKSVERDIISGRADPLGHLNDSRKGLGTYYRYQPRRIDRLAELQGIKGYEPKIHNSVFERIKGSAGAYAPIVLPRAYSIVDKDGNVRAPDIVVGHEDGTQAEAREHAQERVWDEVWKRRVVYFATLFVSAILFLVPWLGGVSLPQWVPFIDKINAKDKCTDSVLCFLAGVPKLLGGFLPGFTSTWVDAYSANPGVFALLVGIIIALGLKSSSLKTSINDLMFGVWDNHKKATVKPPKTLIENIRENYFYKLFFKSLKHYIIPWAFGIFAAASLYVYLPYVAANRIAFAVMDARGAYCREAEETKANVTYSDPTQGGTFDSKSVCWATGKTLLSGGTYEITLILGQESWNTGGYMADPEGRVEDPEHSIPTKPWWLRAAGFLTKRYVMEGDMVPIARIADTKKNRSLGQDEYVLRPLLAAADKERVRVFKSRITAASEGQLFLYVNDSILRWPNEYYSNNQGKAEVFVRRVTLDEPMAPQVAPRK